MFIPLWNSIGYKKKTVNKSFGDGINTAFPGFDIGESELMDSVNMCSDFYPAISVRADRIYTSHPTLVSALTAFGHRNDEDLHAVANGVWNYAGPASSSWAVMSSTFSTRKGHFVEFNTQAVRYTILCDIAATSGSSEVNWACDGSTTLISLTSNNPHSNLYVSHKYRLWGVDGNLRTLKHSAAGSVIDWVTSLDAGAYDLTDAKGPITAIASYGGSIIVWTAKSMHMVMGSHPGDFSIINVCETGCTNNYCHVEYDGVLYFANKDGIYAFKGGAVTLISEPVRKYYDSGVSTDYYMMGAADNKIYYILTDTKPQLKCFLIYDIVTKKWHRQSGAFLGIHTLNNILYGQTLDFKLQRMNSTSYTGLDNSTAISYEFNTKIYNNPYLDQNAAVNEVWLKHHGTGTATLNVAFSTLSDTGTGAASYTTFIESTNLTHSTYSIKQQTLLCSTRLDEQPWYHMKFSGTGYKVVDSFQFNYCVFGDDE